MRIVHYINQFFGQIGGEEVADYPLEVREGCVGPGVGLQKALGDSAQIVATIICGDTYFVEHKEGKKEQTCLLLVQLFWQVVMVLHAEKHVKVHMR